MLIRGELPFPYKNMLMNPLFQEKKRPFLRQRKCQEIISGNLPREKSGGSG